MSLFSETMRLGRKTVTKQEKNYSDCVRELNSIDPKLEGSKLYDETAEKIKQRHETERKRIAAEAKAASDKSVAQMRENLTARLSKDPTTDQVNTLLVLRTLDSITPRELQLYAAQMSNCPLAMKSLAQYAEGQKMRLATPDAEALMYAVDVLESNLTALCNYTGNEDEAPASLRMILQYFKSDGDYQTMTGTGTREIDRKFWADIVQHGTPEMLDADGTYTPASPKYYFRDVDDMLAYMDKATAGLNEKAAEDRRNEILQNSPGQYGAAYRCYKTTGEKVPLLDDGESL